MHGQVVITGASRGIGRALCHAFAARGHRLVACARSRGELDQLAQEIAERHKVGCQVVAADLATAEGRRQLLDSVQGPVQGLVNNAGFGTAGLFEQVEAARDTQMVRLNCEAVVDLCHLFLPRLVAAEGAFIVNVASTAAFQPVPLFAAYAATKAFVLSFSEALADELSPRVHVLALCPGVTKSGFQAAADVVIPDDKAPTSEEVARFCLLALERKDRVAVHGAKNAFLALSSRFAPRKMVVQAARKMMEPWFAGRAKTG